MVLNFKKTEDQFKAALDSFKDSSPVDECRHLFLRFSTKPYAAYVAAAVLLWALIATIGWWWPCG